MKKCWASALGGCSGKSSREHLVSRGILEGRELKVRGFPWCKSEFVSVGIDSITSKVLCTHHNELLSEVDAAGIHAFDVFDKAAELSVQRADDDQTKHVLIRGEIDGQLLERWFLKTFINLTYRSKYFLGMMGEQPGVPPRYLLDVASGTVPFSHFMGLYALVLDGHAEESRRNVNFTPIFKDGRYAAMGLFSFRGVDFLLSLVPSPPPDRLAEIDISGPPAHLLQARLRYRVPRIGLGRSGTEFHRIDIRWPNIPWTSLAEAQALDSAGKLTERVLTEYGWYAPTGKDIG